MDVTHIITLPVLLLDCFTFIAEHMQVTKAKPYRALFSLEDKQLHKVIF